MIGNRNLALVVEGPGEVSAAPDLVRRILYETYARYDIRILRPKNAAGKPNLLKKMEQFLEYAILENCSAILVLVDADEECPYTRALELANRASSLQLSVPVSIVCPKSEYETWFICNLSQNGGDKIRDALGIPQTVTAPDNVENIRGAKEWLNRNMPHAHAYKETSDQKPLTHYIDLNLTQTRSRSFRRLCHAVEGLIYAMDNGLTIATPTTS
jgi:hypothetical protein